MLNKIYFTLGLIALPLFSFAQDLGKTSDLLTGAKDIVTNILIPLVFSLALLLFFYGVVKFIWSEGQGKEDGKKFMIWGVIALFVMTSIWGIIQFMADELGIWDPNADNSMKIPKIDQNI